MQRVAILGAGSVGLSICRSLSALDGLEIICLDKNKSFGLETSSRNSEVIHAGLYYPQGSMKLSLCRSGKDMIYEFCKEYDVPYKNCEKYLIATNKEQHSALDRLQQNNPSLIPTNTNSIEPGIRINEHTRVLVSPNTGIFDAGTYMQRLYAQAEENGVMFSFDSKITKIEKNKVICNESEFEFEADHVINCTGLGSTFLDPRYQPRFIKGTYYSVTSNLPKKHPFKFNKLIYPMPEVDLTGLGVHLTFDMEGNIRFGPDIEEVTPTEGWEENYRLNTVDRAKQESIFKLVKEYIDFEYFYGSESFQDFEVQSLYSGIRPKVKGENLSSDFVVDKQDNIIHLHGIESPGLTSSLAIADHVREKFFANFATK